jgi:hypothetical protein
VLTKLAFLAMRDFLNSHRADQETQMPDCVKKHLLFAVLEHSGGDYRSHIFTHLTQAADRMQIYGAEGFLRFLASDMGVKGISLFPKSDSSIQVDSPLSYGHPEDKSIVGHLWYFIRSGNDFPGREKLVKVSARILYLMIKGTALEGAIFASSTGSQGSANRDFPGFLQRAKEDPEGSLREKIQQIRSQCEEFNLEQLALSFVSAPGATLLNRVRIKGANCVAEDQFLARLYGTSGTEKSNLRDAIIYALAIRLTEPTADINPFLEGRDPFVKEIANLIKESSQSN